MKGPLTAIIISSVVAVLTIAAAPSTGEPGDPSSFLEQSNAAAALANAAAAVAQANATASQALERQAADYDEARANNKFLSDKDRDEMRFEASKSRSHAAQARSEAAKYAKESRDMYEQARISYNFYQQVRLRPPM